ncbi:MAG TPA: hypothetical protein VFQ53_19085 [Kofleriaceae bacterium]|nr:hypothetical protein [Kofleriaceae bacterium]
MTDIAKFQRSLVEVTVSAPADEVWRALRDKERIQQWFGWDADTLNDEIDYIFFQHAKADDANRTLQFEGIADRFEVEPRGAQSVLRIVRAAPTEDHDWDDIFDDLVQGWISFVHQLRFMFERHRDQTRRTLFLSGVPKHAHAAAALGLPPSAAGSKYAITAPMGDALAGQIWHRGKHQQIVTVDGVGDGLLVVLDRATDKPLSMVTLTTYGLDDRTFTELEARWRTWWAEHFTPQAPPCEPPPQA